MTHSEVYCTDKLRKNLFFDETRCVGARVENLLSGRSVDIGADKVVFPERDMGARTDFRSPTNVTQTYGLCGLAEEDVVVEVDEMFGQVGNSVQVVFDYHGIECGEELFRYVVLVVYQMYLGIVGIEPFRFLTASHEMYSAHPWSEFLHPAEPVSQESVIAETGIRHSVFRDVALSRPFREILLPYRIIHIYPCDDKIDIHTCCDNID